MKKFLLLFILFLACITTQAQNLTADEAVLLYHMRKRLPENNNTFFYMDYEMYCQKFFLSEWVKAKNNEFALEEFSKKMEARFGLIFKGFDSGNTFTYTSYNKLGQYDFTNQSFTCSGPGLPIFKYWYNGGGELTLRTQTYNWEKFSNFKLVMKSDVAKAFLENHSDRRVYLVSYYAFTNTDSGEKKLYNITLKKVDVYANKELTSKLMTIQ